MATNANYAAGPRFAAVTVSAANTALDGTGTLATIITAAARNLLADPPTSGGTRIEGVTIKALQATTAGMIRLFVHDGTTAHLIHEEPVTATPIGADAPSFSALIDLGGLAIPAGHSLRASTHNAESFKLSAFGGDF